MSILKDDTLNLNHLAIVMDGNGRWAQARDLPRFEGHRRGLASVKCALQSCINFKIPYLSLFAFSKENWCRPSEEVTFLMQLFVDALDQELPEINANKIRITFGGDTLSLSSKILDKMAEATRKTADNDLLHVHIALNYSGRWDIMQALKKISQNYSSMELSTLLDNENAFYYQFQQALSTAHLPEPDLLIRTSGEQRISNYYLWQLAYTELYFTDTLWPDFNEQNFADAIKSYVQRERRFGKVAAVNNN
jgi:undecaprenyl diphosphate synthase